MGYLAQEPELEGKTVKDAIEPAVAKSREVILSVQSGAQRGQVKVFGVRNRGLQLLLSTGATPYFVWLLCSRTLSS